MHLELLSPVRNLACGMAAIHAGADALYVGAPRFGARAAVGNTIGEIEKLVREAHIFDVRVYATLNTLLRNDELSHAQNLAWELHAVGVDALIVQDMAWMQMHLPPIELHASTQTDNRTIEKIQFLERIGFTRVVLARELSPKQIAAIRKKTSIELEAFVHGALCVCYSGQCYLSEFLGGRSANRGECAQPCRRPYRLEQLDGKRISEGHLLSLRDLHRAEQLENLIDAGVSSFKIEGRLKDLAYVQNVTAYYSHALDGVANRMGPMRRASRGRCMVNFTPDPHLTFARPFTPYLLDRRDANLAYIATPKSMGELLGRVVRIAGTRFWIDTNRTLRNGDGLAIVSDGMVHGVRIQRALGQEVHVREMPHGMRVGDLAYRNSNIQARNLLSTQQCQRSLQAVIALRYDGEQGYSLELRDEADRMSTMPLPSGLQPARNEEQQRAAWAKQLAASADARLRIVEVEVCDGVPFMPIKEMNALRRSLIERHTEMLSKRRLPTRVAKRTPAPYPHTLPLDERLNITNRWAQDFYRACGVVSNAKSFDEKQHPPQELMRTAYCVRWELGICPRQTGLTGAEPLRLVGAEKPLFLHFDCEQCEMTVHATPTLP